MGAAVLDHFRSRSIALKLLGLAEIGLFSMATLFRAYFYYYGN